MKKILSHGGGLQTTAIVIMMAKGEVVVDEVVFADTAMEDLEEISKLMKQKPKNVKRDGRG